METYEEKYKDLVKRLNKAREEKGVYTFNSVLDAVAPELKIEESEDERIRKEILDYIIKGSESCYDVQQYGKERFEKWISWLEKQGEQKPKFEPKFKVGDVMRTTQEAADGIKDGMPVVVSIDEEYYHCNNELIAIKDQDSYEYPPMNRIQNPAWSEEDETGWTNTMIIIKECAANHYTKDSIDLVLNWLKSLKDRYTWKPSDEQMNLLREVQQALLGRDCHNRFVNFMYELKRLREK